MNSLLFQNESFFEDLFRQYYKALKAYAFKYVGDMDTAEDIVQDVFFECWLKRDNIRIETQIRPYLFKAVSNKSLNFLKSKEEREKVPLEIRHESQIQDFYLKSLVAEQEDFLLLKELNEEIKSCVDRLPEQCRKIFILRHTYDLKNREIAEQLNISIKAVEKQITKALFEIRRHLQRLDLLPFVIYVLLRALS